MIMYCMYLHGHVCHNFDNDLVLELNSNCTAFFTYLIHSFGRMDWIAVGFASSTLRTATNMHHVWPILVFKHMFQFIHKGLSWAHIVTTYKLCCSNAWFNHFWSRVWSWMRYLWIWATCFYAFPTCNANLLCIFEICGLEGLSSQI